MRITDKIYLMDSTRGAYAYLVMGEEPLLIDTGFAWKGKSIIRELVAMGVRLRDIRHILLTHFDLDHIGNAALLLRLTAATLWASCGDKPYILGEKPRPGFKKYLPYIFRTKTPEAISVFEGGDRIGGVEVIPTPGHTPGHVCMLYGNVLFAGDLVKNDKGNLVPYPNGWNWDSAMLLDSIRAVNKFHFDWVCPAHGAPMMISEPICPEAVR